uniref:Uncharacterized protein n=1 Tax=Ananas comosus var. bracteatus TaxID=296719 RepID=A0A6V7QU11_ANACO
MVKLDNSKMDKKQERSSCSWIIACFTCETEQEKPPPKEKPSKLKMTKPLPFQKLKEDIMPTKRNNVEGTTTVTKPPSTTKDDPPMKETATTSEAAGDAKKGTTATVHLNLKIPTKE